MGHLLLLICISLSNRYQSPRLTLHLLQRQRLSKFLQMVPGLLVSLSRRALLVPEEAGDILGGGFDHRVGFEHLELAEQLVG